MSEPKYGVIESGVPIPSKRATGGMSELLSQLNAGDSTLVSMEQANTARTTLSRLDGKFTTRKVDGGVRIWRVE